jgi:hypothetical protein
MFWLIILVQGVTPGVHNNSLTGKSQLLGRACTRESRLSCGEYTTESRLPCDEHTGEYRLSGSHDSLENLAPASVIQTNFCRLPGGEYNGESRHPTDENTGESIMNTNNFTNIQQNFYSF